jgi:hypothetical protein
MCGSYNLAKDVDVAEVHKGCGRVSVEKRAAKLLDRARQKLVKYGWRRGSYGSPRTGFCSVGAIYNVSKGRGSIRTMAFEALERAIGLNNVVQWNDIVAKNKRQVLGAFRRAQTYLEKKA